MDSVYSCAIHQPNFFPRLSTLAKLRTADVRIVLDDVQFVRRDYQHRCRLGALNRPDIWHWLSLPVTLPYGQTTQIRDVRLVDALRARRYIERALRHQYARSPHWAMFQPCLTGLFELLAATDRLAEVAELSTRILLEQVRWHGKVIRSSELDARSGRSDRLADLARSVGASRYLCGSGGARYLDEIPFAQLGIAVAYVKFPPQEPPTLGAWTGAKRISALWALMRTGPGPLSRELRRTHSADDDWTTTARE